MSVFSAADFDGHEQVVFCSDAGSGLRAVIAIHNCHRGPALGGCRMWPYASEHDAVRDALRLSRGMTYKSAMARLPLHRSSPAMDRCARRCSKASSAARSPIVLLPSNTGSIALRLAEVHPPKTTATSASSDTERMPVSS